MRMLALGVLLLLIITPACDSFKLQQPSAFAIASFEAAPAYEGEGPARRAVSVQATVVVSGMTAADENGKLKVSVETRLELTDPTGAAVTLPPDVATRGVEDLLEAAPANLTLKMGFPLPGLTPGEYTLKLIARDRLGGSELVQSIPLTIEGETSS